VVMNMVTTFTDANGERTTRQDVHEFRYGPLVVEPGSAVVKNIDLAPCPGTASALETRVYLRNFDGAFQEVVLMEDLRVSCSGRGVR
jgi:hypothetical protein